MNIPRIRNTPINVAGEGAEYLEGVLCSLAVSIRKTEDLNGIIGAFHDLLLGRPDKSDFELLKLQSLGIIVRPLAMGIVDIERLTAVIEDPVAALEYERELEQLVDLRAEFLFGPGAEIVQFMSIVDMDSA